MDAKGRDRDKEGVVWPEARWQRSKTGASAQKAEKSAWGFSCLALGQFFLGPGTGGQAGRWTGGPEDKDA